MPAGVVDQDATHDQRRGAKKMRSILPVDLTLIDEPEIRLVNQRGRLERVVDPFFPKLARGDAAHLRVDERQQLVKRTAVAATPVREERRDLGRGHKAFGTHRIATTSPQRQAFPFAVTHSGGNLRDL